MIHTVKQGEGMAPGAPRDGRAAPQAPTGGSAGQRPGASTGLLEDWISRDQLASELSLSVDTLSRWETRRIGPPCVRVGRKVLYRRGAVQDWLVDQEKRAGRGKGGR